MEFNLEPPRCECGLPARESGLCGDCEPTCSHGPLRVEERTLADGAGGISTNYNTGEVTSYMKPCTRQRRWVTDWETITR
jgi:hypothetical protein